MKPVFLISLIVVSCLYACDSNEEKKTEPEKIDSLNYSYLERSYTIDSTISVGEEDSYITLRFPVFKGGDNLLNDSLNNLVSYKMFGVRKFDLAYVDSAIYYFKEDYLKMLDACKNDAEEDMEPYASYESSSVEVIYQNPKIISFSYGSESYSGQAHPSNFTDLINYLLQEKRILTLADLFEKNSIEKLFPIAEKAFKEVRELKTGVAYEEMGFDFKDGKFTLAKNFLIKKGSLSFYYNSYDVAPYVMGPTEIELKTPLFEELLKPEARAYFE